MKKVLFITSLLVSGIFATGSGVWAQGSSSNEFTLEEITVTAEKRSANLEKVATSIVALDGSDLSELSKATTAEILRDLPNISFSEVGGARPPFLNSNPNGGVSIRGINFDANTTDGQPPSATATYVDDVFQGIGGDYDINRVEVLRGPQGTLYGRSSTAGVVSFHTNDPKLSEFSGNVSFEGGTASRKNVEAAVNIPLGDQFALRVAGHYIEQDGYSYNPDGGWYKNIEGRIKAKYQPTDKLQILASLSMFDHKDASGGYTAYLTAPDKINYHASFVDAVRSGPRTSDQASLNVNYDFGGSALTYVGSYRDYKDDSSPPFFMTPPGQVLQDLRINPGEHFWTHEVRLTSNTEGWWTWLIGANYYKGDYKRTETTTQVAGSDFNGNPDPQVDGALVFTQNVNGYTVNYGVFTEETFNLRKDLRLTAGLRYDKTEVKGFESYLVNMNFDQFGNNFSTPVNNMFASIDDTLHLSDVTYKLRLEYDVTPNNLLYVLTSSGFLPGTIKLTNFFVYPPGSFAPTSVEFIKLPEDEQKLITYEMGSKNRFWDNKLQLNGDVFYYDFTGYRTTLNVAPPGPNAPDWVTLGTPERMIGAELEGTWLITSSDKVSLTAGYTNKKMKKFPTIPGIGSIKTYMAKTQDTIFSANLNYEHVFAFDNGSTLVPRAILHYTPGKYLTTLTQAQLNAGRAPYAWQDSYVLGDINVTWTSPNGMYAVTGNVKNITDKEYKTGVTIYSGGPYGNNTVVNVGDPRTIDLMLKVKF
jgi:outer membrane receptor protein involved in Fe transport